MYKVEKNIETIYEQYATINKKDNNNFLSIFQHVEFQQYNEEKFSTI